MQSMNDLRVAVARADEVLGCAFTQCRHKPQRDGLPGRCQCGMIDVSANVLEAVYRAAKAVVEEQVIPVRGLEFATLEPYLNREVEFMGVRGTITDVKYARDASGERHSMRFGPAESNEPGQDGSEK